MTKVAAFVGACVLSACRGMGGMLAMGLRSIAALALLRIDVRETVRAIHAAGVVPAGGFWLTLLGTGMLLGAGTGAAVQSFGASSLAGFAVGYAVFDEAGPLLAGILFTSQVVVRNAAMLAAGPPEELCGPDVSRVRRRLSARVMGMAVSLPLLGIVGFFALLAGAAAGGTLLGMSWAAFQASLQQNVHIVDFLRGTLKMAVFGFAASVSSHYFGLRASAAGEPASRAVENAVSVSVAGIAILNFLLTFAFS